MLIQRPRLLGAEADGDPLRGVLRKTRQTPLDQLFFLEARIVDYLSFLVCRLVYSNLKLDARLISPRWQ